MVFEANRACLEWLIGDDSGRLCWLFQDAARVATRGLRLLVAGPEVAVRWTAAADGRNFLLLYRLPDRGKSSENMGAVRGDDARLDCSLLDVVDAVSDMVSLLDAGLFLLMRCSSCGSMASRLIFSQPFCILTFANARRSCRALVICRRDCQHSSWHFSCSLHTLDTCARRKTFSATSSCCRSSC